MVSLTMKVLFSAFRVRDLNASLAFYTTVGFEVVGRVEGAEGTRMAMLALPQQSEVSLELVHSDARGLVTPGGFDHLAVQVDDLEATRTTLVSAGLDVGPVETPGGPDGPRTESSSQRATLPAPRPPASRERPAACRFRGQTPNSSCGAHLLSSGHRAVRGA